MPTGTLCAERNAIGNALAGDQSVRRRTSEASPCSPSTSTRKAAASASRASAPRPLRRMHGVAQKIGEINPDFKVLTFSTRGASGCSSRPSAITAERVRGAGGGVPALAPAFGPSPGSRSLVYGTPRFYL